MAATSKQANEFLLSRASRVSRKSERLRLSGKPGSTPFYRARHAAEFPEPLALSRVRAAGLPACAPRKKRRRSAERRCRMVRAASLAGCRRLSTLRRGALFFREPALHLWRLPYDPGRAFRGRRASRCSSCPRGKNPRRQRLPPSTRLLAGGLIAAGRSPGSPGARPCESRTAGATPSPASRRLEKRPSEGRAIGI